MGENSLTVPNQFPTDEDAEELGTQSSAMGYQQTLMYGRYSKSMADEIREQAKRHRLVEKRRKKEQRKRRKELSGTTECNRKAARVITFIWKNTFARIGEDWVFLAALGVIMALISFAMDYTISLCNKSRLWLVRDLVSHPGLQFLAWTSLPVFLILFAAGFVHIVAPQAIGSGIPEMKTILRGVVLKEYLTFRTLIAKVVGLTATLGSGMPLGKEGPFVHIASIVATLLTKMVTSFQGIYANESRNSEMLAAACAVGVACCFGSPIGGVLFSIEVTSVYFAVRNYWRGFFAAVCGAVIFRLLSIWFEDEETIVAVFRTGFKMDFPYDPQELVVFALIGVFCGIGGSMYVYIHRRYVLWMRGNKRLTKFLQKNRFIYPFFISFLISSLSFPAGPGMFQAADITTHEQIEILFSNYTWARNVEDMTPDEYSHIKHWMDIHTKSIFVNLTVYILSTFFLSILASTLPVPTGVLIPSFKVGAAFGRMIGEAMHVWFPDGVRYGDQISYILPGGYATVGAAAFSGAVTHTISISVIVFEMTGQVTHCVPVLVAVIIANFVAGALQPSCYDSIIMIKKLPYLPDIIPSSTGGYNIYVENFMVKDVKYIWYGMTYRDLRDVLKDGKKLKGFPLVDNPSQMILLGSVQRFELITAIEKQIGKDRRLAEAAIRRKEEAERRRREDAEKRLLEEQEKLRKQEEESKLVNIQDGNGDIDLQGLNRARRPSRFAVSAVDEMKNSAEDKPVSLPLLNPKSPAMRALEQLNAQPKKSILKKNNLTVHGFSDNRSSPVYSPYETYTGGNELWRNTVQSLQQYFRRGSGFTSASRASSGWDFGFDLNGSSPMGSRRGTRPDLTEEEQKDWEEREMDKPVSFGDLHIDPAPFQLVEKSNLLKVHSLFSMLGVNLAYVTAIGRLIGVVGLRELRQAIENANTNKTVDEEKKSGVAANTTGDINITDDRDVEENIVSDDTDTEEMPMTER